MPFTVSRFTVPEPFPYRKCYGQHNDKCYWKANIIRLKQCREYAKESKKKKRRYLNKWMIKGNSPACSFSVSVSSQIFNFKKVITLNIKREVSLKMQPKI